MMENPLNLVSAVVILMPPPVVAFAEDYHQRNGAGRFLPPHITLMWPFVSPGTIQEGAEPAVLEFTINTLRGVCRQVAPFVVSLDHYDTFPGVLYLAPHDSGPIVDLHERLLAVFPDYPPYGSEFGGLTPHMSLSFFETEKALAAAPRPVFDAFDFRVTEVAWLYGEPSMTTPWKTAAMIPLGGK